MRARGAILVSSMLFEVKECNEVIKFNIGQSEKQDGGQYGEIFLFQWLYLSELDIQFNATLWSSGARNSITSSEYKLYELKKQDGGKYGKYGLNLAY